MLATIAGVIVGLLLLALSLVAPERYAVVRGIALDATAPVTGSLRAVTSTISGLASGATDYWDAAEQNGELKRDNHALMQQMIEARAVRLENAQLKAALQLRERTREAVTTGRIVGSSYASPRRFAVLSAGSGDGVEVGMPGAVGGGIDRTRRRGRAVREPHPADQRPRQHRSRTTAPRRAAGHLDRAW